MLVRAKVSLLALVCWSCLLTIASAQAPADKALQPGDPTQAAQRAEVALFAGALKPAQWAELNFTLGVARARLGDMESARRAFICALALDPTRRLESSAPVEVRSPFMEARGFWSQYTERLAASAALSEDGTTLLVSLIDPAALSARVLVRVRGVGQARFVETALPPASSMLVSLEALPRQAGVEYSLALIDENANRLWQLGTDDAPLSAQGARPVPEVEPVLHEPPAHAAPAASAAATQEVRSARPYYIGATLSLLGAGAALVVAGVNHAERQHLASRWNHADCDGEGTTRGEVCQHEHYQLERAQRMAVGFYAAGGAALVAGLITLIAAPRRSERRSTRASSGALALRCRPGPGEVGVACGASF
jgi:hypothetical protein